MFRADKLVKGRASKQTNEISINIYCIHTYNYMYVRVCKDTSELQCLYVCVYNVLLWVYSGVREFIAFGFRNEVHFSAA